MFLAMIDEPTATCLRCIYDVSKDIKEQPNEKHSSTRSAMRQATSLFIDSVKNACPSARGECTVCIVSKIITKYSKMGTVVAKITQYTDFCLKLNCI